MRPRLGCFVLAWREVPTMKGHQTARPPEGLSRRKSRSRRPLLPRDATRREQRLGATLGRALRAARMRAGFTQADLAASIGKAPEVYGRLERGKMLPSVPTLFRLCVALRSGPHELMGFAPVGSLPDVVRSEVPPELTDTPEMRRLLRLLGRLQGLQVKLILRLVMSLVAER
ncbi:helix-turn-helix transcriptional regulator [Hyalangium sp.]|uniref:helix-turn-helix transcriptional regulator n=1 Tax=Hyalangium sp. TaxID=2028555 RepID=UPI00389AD37D